MRQAVPLTLIAFQIALGFPIYCTLGDGDIWSWTPPQARWNKGPKCLTSIFLMIVLHANEMCLEVKKRGVGLSPPLVGSGQMLIAPQNTLQPHSVPLILFSQLLPHTLQSSFLFSPSLSFINATGSYLFYMSIRQSLFLFPITCTSYSVPTKAKPCALYLLS